MCTGLTLETKDGCHLFGRSMDIPLEFNQSVNFIPRNFSWKNVVTNESSKTKYAILGMATIIDEHPMFADGLNEMGLSCAGLYFGGFAEYEEDIISEKENMGPYDLILWALGNFQNLTELKDALKNLNIVNKPFSPSVPLPLLHWIVSDKSGNSIVIEKTKDKLNIFDNPIGVLTNSPPFDWHLINLRQYIGLRPKQSDNIKFINLEIAPFSQGSGAFGLPGDFTSPSRFVRATFLKNNITCIDNEAEGITGFFHILSNCSMPSGSILTTDNHNYKTIYTAAMCLETGTYYYHTYDNRQINSINLFKEDLNSKEIKSYPYRNKQSIFCENYN